MTNKNADIYTVSQVNAYISRMFTQNDILNHISMKGEISNCKYHSSGHIYFTLKDNGGQIACVMFAGNASKLSFRLEEGIGVIAKGAVKVFERDGKYQLYVEAVRPAGIGALYEMYERLKKRLEAEGIFAAEHKKQIPFYSRRVGIITAKTGAAVQDIISISKRRNPYVQLVLYPAQVQGSGSLETLLAGLHALEQEKVDVIIIGRGGGSLEDLWTFNEEALARELYRCPIPVISAVGHETDFTIADYAADLRAPTPSAAAELAVCDIGTVLAGLVDLHSDLYRAMLQKINEKRKETENIRLNLKINSPRGKLEQKRKQLEAAGEALPRLMQQRLLNARHRTALYLQQLKGLSPLDKLQSGFSYVSGENGKAVKSVEQVNVNDIVTITVTDGSLKASVCEKIREEKLSYEES